MRTFGIALIAVATLFLGSPAFASPPNLCDSKPWLPQCDDGGGDGGDGGGSSIVNNNTAHGGDAQAEGGDAKAGAIAGAGVFGSGNSSTGPVTATTGPAVAITGPSVSGVKNAGNSSSTSGVKNSGNSASGSISGSLSGVETGDIGSTSKVGDVGNNSGNSTNKNTNVGIQGQFLGVDNSDVNRIKLDTTDSNSVSIGGGGGSFSPSAYNEVGLDDFGNSSATQSQSAASAQDQGQDQGQEQAQTQDTDQANAQDTDVNVDASDRSTTIVEDAKDPVASAAPVFASACSAGISAQSYGFGGALANTNPMCDLALGIELAIKIGDFERARVLMERAHEFAFHRTNPVRMYGQWIPFLGQLF